MREFIKIINYKGLSFAFAVFLLVILLCTSIFAGFSGGKTDQPLAKKVNINNGNNVNGSYERPDINQFINSKIELTLESSMEGFSLEYTEVKNRTYYEIYRKLKGENKFTLIITTQETKYLDETVVSGKTYVYKVRAVLKQKEGQLNGKCSNKVKKKFVKFDENKKMVALTFDDGPGKYTNAILKCLDKYDAHATFFVLGSQVNEYKSAVKKADLIGCEIGSHTYDHVNLTTLSKKGIKSQINKTDKRLEAVIGHGATLMRPPYGFADSTVKKTVKKPIITWNVDTRDWETRSASQTYKNVMKEVSDGSIILMHDIHGSTKKAVLKIIPELKKKGYQIVTVSELAEYKNTKLINGKVYSKIK